MSDSKRTWPGIERLKKYGLASEVDLDIVSFLSVSIAEIKQKGIFIFGTGKLGQKIHRFFSKHSIPISGYVDNNMSLHGKLLNDSKIVSVDSLKPDSIVYIASETFLNPIFKQLRENSIFKTLSHLQASILFKTFSDFPADAYLQNLTEDIIDHRNEYLKVFSLLTDDNSKEVLDCLISYRLTGDIKFIDQVARPSEWEYFDKGVLKVGTSEVFFDCGGFDGDSAQNFISYCDSQYKSVHIFEPDSRLLSKAKQRLEGCKNVVFNELGIYDRTTTLNFDNTGGLDGSINATGDTSIQVISLDEYKTEVPPSYIKLDIEGAEIEAIRGAKSIIKTHHPKLAIASYHIPDHLWRIPLMILEIFPGYSLHMGHYTNYMLGSTYYFLPD